MPAPGRVTRFAHGLGSAGLPEPWDDGGDPLVHVTFGSVTAGAHLPYYPGLYRAAIDALAPLRARIILAIGEDRDPAELGTLPPNVRVERWVSHAAVMPRAAAVVGHGGYGTTLDALGYGTPLVVVPLFSLDQWANADAVARVGAGIALVAERGRRAVLDPRGRRRSTGSAPPSRNCWTIRRTGAEPRPSPPPGARSRRSRPRSASRPAGRDPVLMRRGRAPPPRQRWRAISRRRP